MIVTDEAYWRGHSRRLSKPRKVGFDSILRKCFKENMKEYVNQCSLGGVKQIFEPGISTWRRLLWIAVFITGGLTCGYFLMYIWTETLNRPFIVSLESSTYHISNVIFPAVAICNINRLSKKAVHLFATERYANLATKNESLEEVEMFLLQLGGLLDFRYHESLTKKPIYSTFTDLYRKDTHKIVDIMEKLSPSCEEMLLGCAWAGEVVDCKQLFTTRTTIQGHCCTFNYVLDYKKSPSLQELLRIIKKQKQPGYWYGLNLILDPLIDDYAYPTRYMLGFDVLVYPPVCFPDVKAGRVVQHVVEPNTATYFEVHTTTQRAAAEVRKYSADTRSCLFRDERKTNFGPLYTYSACIVRCRLMTLQSLCKCTPYFINIFSRAKDRNVCSLDDLRCLNKYKVQIKLIARFFVNKSLVEKLELKNKKLWYLYPHNAKDTTGLEMEVEESLYCPECLPDCELTKHDIKSYATPLFAEGYPEKAFVHGFTETVNMTNKSTLSIYHPVPDTILNRLDVVNYWYEIISNVGGFGGIILGFSAISIVEIIYFCCIRYFICVYKKYVEYNK